MTLRFSYERKPQENCFVGSLPAYSPVPAPPPNREVPPLGLASAHGHLCLCPQCCTQPPGCLPGSPGLGEHCEGRTLLTQGCGPAPDRGSFSPKFSLFLQGLKPRTVRTDRFGIDSQEASGQPAHLSQVRIKAPRGAWAGSLSCAGCCKARMEPRGSRLRTPAFFLHFLL